MDSTSLQPSMDSSDWLHVPSSSSGATEPMGSSSSSMEKRLRPHQDHTQLVHCPRCDSARTKFCYYNNYSLSQPRYFCKSCRRYWTKGGTLRNIPVGGVSRKNKRLSAASKKHTAPNRKHRQQQPQKNPESPVKLSAYPSFTFENLTIDFMESGGVEFEGGDQFPAVVASGGYWSDMGNTHWLNPGTMAYDHGIYENIMNGVDAKARGFGFEWQEQTGCHSDLYGSGEGRNGPSGTLGLGSSWAG